MRAWLREDDGRGRSRGGTNVRCVQVCGTELMGEGNPKT